MASLETQTKFSRVTAARRSPSRYLWLVLGALLAACSFWFDAAVQEWMTQQQTPDARAFMRQVSWWGDWPAHVAVGLIGAAVSYAAGSRRWLGIFAAMVLACAVAGIVNRAIKMGAGRARPSVEIDAGWNGPRLSSKYHAFPSGHTAATTGFFAALCFARPHVGLLFVLIPILIAFSRMYLGAHHLSDVTCAALLGIIVAALLTPVVQRRLDRARIADAEGAR